MISKRAFLGLLLVSWFPFFVRAVQFYAASNLTNIPQASLLAPSADTFRQFLEQQQIFVFFVTVYVGAGLIANDRRANALQIYLSKPLTRAEYVLGKLAILMTFLAAGHLAAGDRAADRADRLRRQLHVLQEQRLPVPGDHACSRSSRSRSPRRRCWRCRRCRRAAATSAILYAAVIFFTQAVYGVLYAVTRSTAFSWLSFSANLAQIGDVIFRQPLQVRHAVAGLAADDRGADRASRASILERRVRGVEVVA